MYVILLIAIFVSIYWLYGTLATIFWMLVFCILLMGYISEQLRRITKWLGVK